MRACPRSDRAADSLCPPSSLPLVFSSSQRWLHPSPAHKIVDVESVSTAAQSVGDAARKLEQAKKDIPPEPEALREKAPPQVRPKAQAALSSPYLITPDHVKRAFKRINQTVLRTPCDFSPRISPIVGSNLYLKKEHLSITGSYKERGALNKLLQLTEEEKARGVICSSAGNHAQAVSYHSTRLGIDGVIVMPVNAPHTKVRFTHMLSPLSFSLSLSRARVYRWLRDLEGFRRASSKPACNAELGCSTQPNALRAPLFVLVQVKSTREFGARVVQAGESFAEAYEHAVKLAKDEGRTFIHAFNDPEVVAGQGTVAMELLEQNPYMDAVVVPVGGGGLIAGMALLLKSINPRIKIYGVETKAMPGMYRSLKAGKLESVPKKPSMADGIAIEHVGAIAFDIIRDHVDDIVLVDEDEVAQAVLLMLEKEKTVTEGSGAAGLAALMSGKLPQVKDKNVVCVVTGSNIDMSLLQRIIEKGLVMSGRLARIHVTVLDVPGQLAR